VWLLVISIAVHSQIITWTGTVDTDWHKPCNWDQLRLPTCSDTVIIPNVSSNNYPVVTGIAHSKYVRITANVSNALRIQGTGRLDISAGGGACSGTPTNNSGALTNISILGPGFVCLGDTVVWKSPLPSGAMWDWDIPPSWHVIEANYDSIVVVPDTTKGWLSVMVCDSSCNCGSDSLFVIIDSCAPFCLKVNTFIASGIDFNPKTGNTVLCGYTSWFSPINIYVTELSPQGNIKWYKTIGSSGDNRARDVIYTQDGNILIAGYTEEYTTGGNEDIFIAKLDTTGTIIWSIVVGTGQWDEAFAVTETTTGDYIIGGHINNHSIPILLKVDASGNILWIRQLNISGYTYGVIYDLDVGPTDDIVCALSIGYSTNNYIAVVRIDSMANSIKWAKRLSDGDEDVRALALDGNNNVYVTGSTTMYGNNDIIIVNS